MEEIPEIPETQLSDTEPVLESVPVPAPKKRGRPKGSTTKPKVAKVEPPVEPQLDMNQLSMLLASHLANEKKQARDRRQEHWNGFF